jgi:AraC-like DNA-binding protein
MRRILFEEMTAGLVIDRITRDYEYTMPTKHFHNEFEIYYLLEGERYYFIEKETYYVKKGSLVFVDRNQIHKTGFVGKSFHDRILIELKEEPFSTFFSQTNTLSLRQFFSKYNGVLELNEKDQKHVEYLLFGIVKEIQGKSPGYEFMAKQKLAELLLLSLRRKQENTDNTFKKGATAQTAKHIKVHEVAEYITKNYSQTESLEDLAKRFFVSRCYLSRIFKEVTGFTVNEYINIHRIQKGQDLLVNSDYNITEISDLLGYESITYFEKVFKKYTETTPLKYRKTHAVNKLKRDKKAEFQTKI